MTKLSILFLKRFVPSALLAFAAAVLLAPPAANAAPFILKLVQQGNSVVATGSGDFDTSGLSLSCSVCTGTAFETIDPSIAWFNIGAPSGAGAMDVYTGMVTGPSSFGTGSGYEATYTATGSAIIFDATGYNRGVPELILPTGYASGTSLSNTTIWDNASFASLGVTPDTYLWTWGTGADQSFTLVVSNAISVPEPAALGMFGFGALLVGAFVGLRRRIA